MLHDVAEAPVPVLAAINGPAIGAGLQLAIACDLRVADPSAVFGLPTAKLGLAVDPWTIRRLALIASEGAARMLLLACSTLDADLAQARGLVDRIGGLEDTLAWAKEIAGLAPLTLAVLQVGAQPRRRLRPGRPRAARRVRGVLGERGPRGGPAGAGGEAGSGIPGPLVPELLVSGRSSGARHPARSCRGVRPVLTGATPHSCWTGLSGGRPPATRRGTGRSRSSPVARRGGGAGRRRCSPAPRRSPRGSRSSGPAAAR